MPRQNDMTWFVIVGDLGKTIFKNNILSFVLFSKNTDSRKSKKVTKDSYSKTDLPHYKKSIIHIHY